MLQLPRSSAPLFPVLLLFLGSCGVPPARSLQDWAAAHDPETWAPLSEAYLLHDPATWTGGPVEPGWRVGHAPLRAIPQHAAFDLGILSSLGALDPTDFGFSLEASAWACRTLLEEPAPAETQIAAAALLSSYAATWRERYPGDVELVPESVASLPMAEQIQVLVLTARSLRSGHETTKPETLAAMGLNLALDALLLGSNSPHSDVAEACRLRFELLQGSTPTPTAE